MDKFDLKIALLNVFTRKKKDLREKLFMFFANMKEIYSIFVCACVSDLRSLIKLTYRATCIKINSLEEK